MAYLPLHLRLMKPFAVAILNWNGRQLLEQFLPSVVAHSSHLAKVYVIDNASKDASVSFVKTHYPEVKIIELDKNFGYSGGYNKGLNHVEEDIVVLLNSDIETTPGWLDALQQVFISNRKIAACQPKIIDYKNRNRFEYAGAAGGFMDWLCYPFCRGRILYEIENDNGQYNDTIPVFWATGAALAVKRKVFKEVGGLDEMLFAHMEEIDLCWRMKKAGYEVYSCGQSTVYHLGGATLKVQSPQKTFLNFRNNLIIMSKNLPKRELFPKLAVRLVLDGVAGVKFLVEGKGAHSWAIVRAHFNFYAKMPQIFKHRPPSGVLKRLKDYRGTFRGTLITQYFLKNNRKFSELPKRLFTYM